MDAAGDWDGGGCSSALRRARAAARARCTLYRPDIGELLPVYVADRYEGIEARTFAECSDAEIERYVEANVAAVREVAQLVRARGRARQPPRDGPGDPRARAARTRCHTR